MHLRRVMNKRVIANHNRMSVGRDQEWSTPGPPIKIGIILTYHDVAQCPKGPYSPEIDNTCGSIRQ